MTPSSRSLEAQRIEFSNGRFLATPLAGLIAWLVIGVSSFFLSPYQTVWVLFIATGSIVYLGMFISKYTGEDFMDKSKPKNTFDGLFLMTVGMSVLVYAIAIPFFIIDYTSLPLSVGILTGLMWLPFSWIIQHWVGIFHAVSRTVTVLALWYLLPEYRFAAIPFAIVVIYGITLFILHHRPRPTAIEQVPA